MLSREVMGLFCLGVVWITALLVATAAWQDLRDLRALARRARSAIEGTIEGDDLAEWRVEQTGRALDSATPSIAFHDRAFHSEIFGGRVRVAGELVDVAPANGDVWIDASARDAAAACSDEHVFDALYTQARKAKGALRDVRVRVRAGDRVWLVGERAENLIAPLLVSTIDPRAFTTRKSIPLALFIPAELTVCAAATWLALRPPHFGALSIAGALACFAFFLGVTPLAVALRESARRPHEAFSRTTWSRSEPAEARAPAATPTR